MKKIIALLLCTLIISRSFSQKSMFFVGLQAGTNTSSLGDNSNNHNNKSISNFEFGGIIGVNLDPHWSIILAPSYEKVGSVDGVSILVDNSAVGAGSATNSIHFITVPVAGQYSFGKKIKGFINAGFFTGFGLDAREKGSATIVAGPSTGQTVTIDNNLGDVKSQNWGLTFGAGVLFPICHRLQFSLAIRDNKGLTNLSKDGSLKTNSFNYQGGFVYALGS